MNKIIIIALIVAISSLRDEVKVERDSFIQFQDFVNDTTNNTPPLRNIWLDTESSSEISES